MCLNLQCRPEGRRYKSVSRLERAFFHDLLVEDTSMPRLNSSALTRITCVGVALVLLCSPNFYAQTPAKSPAAELATSEPRAARAFEAARANPLDLRAFLARMPKGADLHYHLAGGIYAESWIRAAVEDGLCVDLSSHSFVKPEAVMRSTPPQPICGQGKMSAVKAFADQHVYDAFINAFSMRSFVPSAGVSGHDHFFDSFAKFDGTATRHTGEWLDEIAMRAPSQNEQYIELSATPVVSHTAQIAKAIGS